MVIRLLLKKKADTIRVTTTAAETTPITIGMIVAGDSSGAPITIGVIVAEDPSGICSGVDNEGAGETSTSVDVGAAVLAGEAESPPNVGGAVSSDCVSDIVVTGVNAGEGAGVPELVVVSSNTATASLPPILFVAGQFPSLDPVRTTLPLLWAAIAQQRSDPSEPIFKNSANKQHTHRVVMATCMFLAYHTVLECCGQLRCRHTQAATSMCRQVYSLY